MNLMQLPSRSAPINNRDQAGNDGGDEQPVEAVAGDGAGDEDGEGGGAGPPIWKRLPPSAEMREAPEWQR